MISDRSLPPPTQAVVIPLYNKQDYIAALLAELDDIIAPALDYQLKNL